MPENLDKLFQEEVAESLLDCCAPEAFVEKVNKIAPLLVSDAYRDNCPHLLNYLYTQASERVIIQDMDYKQERQYRAAYAFWNLLPHLPNESDKEIEYKRASRKAAEDLFHNIHRNSNMSGKKDNPYLRDYARSLLYPNPHLRP